MPGKLVIELAPETLDEGSAEEMACFGLLTVRMNDVALTEGVDQFVNAIRTGPLVSGYHAAEWFAWNWWRLRWEPRSGVAEWWRAHEMTAIGEGYVWPDMTIYSDGHRTVLLANPSVRPDARPFRYLGSPPCVVPSIDFEGAVDQFIGQMQGRLREIGVGETNLDRIWREVLAERADPVVFQRRKLEALLGRNADEDNDADINGLIADAEDLGARAVEEIAAESAQDGRLLSGSDLSEIARTSGSASRPEDMVRFAPDTVLPSSRSVVAWRLGAAAANALRNQVHLGTGPITDDRLTSLAGVEAGLLADIGSGAPITFSLAEKNSGSRVVLRQRGSAGRRFELARLLADWIVDAGEDRLHSVTRARTYRQKMQRSFAAEFLCPFDALEDYLHMNYSPERQEDAARHFNVSEMTIRTLLVNHRRLDREDLDEEAAAA